MKVAIISDIHANYQALEAVLKDIREQGCERILCLGDIAMAGPEPQKVIDFVRKQNWDIIQGNTDKMIAEYSPELADSVRKVFPVMGNALADDVKILDNESIDYLKNLPEQKELEIEGVRILLVHGSPRRNNEDILPDRPISEIEEIVKGVNADLIFCGHTHVPCGYQTNNKKTVVNVGSVGRPMTKNPNACYVVADFNNKEYVIEHRFVDYDRETASNLMKSRNFEGSEKLAEMILNPKDRHL
ncbi:metallophosphoesterase family protein [bacterium]|nr:metallophosphoesterase family protein [bacterium]